MPVPRRFPPYSGSPRVDWPAVDVIGDVHGCVHTLDALLGALGYAVDRDDETNVLTRAVHPLGHRLAFVGDFVDRGRHSLAALRSARALTSPGGGGHAAVLGNHDYAAGMALVPPLLPEQEGLEPAGTWVEPVSHIGLMSVGRLAGSDSEAAATFAWLWGLPCQVQVAPAAGAPVGLVVTHAGLTRHEIGAWELADRAAAVWGSLPHQARQAVKAMSAEPAASWVAGEWPGWMREWAVADEGPWSVSGHTPVAQPVVQGRLALIDTGAAAGRGLTAFRWPEATLVRMPTDWQDTTQ